MDVMSDRVTPACKGAGSLAPGTVSRVARGVLYLAAMCIASSTGCVIPTPIQSQPSEMAPPKILTDELQPPLEPPLSHQSNDPITFQIFASDPDIENTLLARLFFQTATGSLVKQGDIQLTSEPTNQVIRSGAFGGSGGQAYCGLVTETTTFLVKAAVTNTPFSNFVDDSTPNDDLDRDEVTWTLTCTD